ncbi:MAG TPA: hypothetical protein VJT31_07840 [Rugosimonospora sp.]|nr:hypothetical protein [Rugosimonospora sp.]
MKSCLLVPVAGALGMAMAAAASELPDPLRFAAAGALLCWVAFTLLPWAVLPVGIIGGAVAGGLVGHGDVKTTVLAHLGILAAGYAGVLTRLLVRPGEGGRQRTTADTAMIGLALLLLAATAYGLSRGNSASRVVVALYELGVIPLYFFAATLTLPTAARQRAAAILYVTVAAVLTALSLTAPGRHGGLISVLAAPPLVVLVGRNQGWRRAGAALLASLFIADTLLSAYRGLWICAGVALLVLLVRGGATVRRGLAVTAALGSAGVLLFGLAVGIGTRSQAVGQALERSPGYRAPEASVGLSVFTDNPLFGAGIGQSTPHVYLPGFGVTDVGPMYHVFYVLVLANLGLVGLGVLLWPILRTLRAGFRYRDDLSLAYAALTCGCLASAWVAGPTDGQWTLGVLPALTLLTLRPGAPTANRPGSDAARPGYVAAPPVPATRPGILAQQPAAARAASSTPLPGAPACPR